MPCRLCLTEEQILIRVFNESGEDTRCIAAAIYKFLTVQLDVRLEPSVQICITCWVSIENFQKFCKEIENKQKLLKEAIIKSSYKERENSMREQCPTPLEAVEVKLECTPDDETILLPACYKTREDESAFVQEHAENEPVQRQHFARSMDSVDELKTVSDCNDLGEWKLFDISTLSAGMHVLLKMRRRHDGSPMRKRCTLCYQKLKFESGSTSLATRKAKQVNTECSYCKKAFCFRCFNKYHHIKT